MLLKACILSAALAFAPQRSVPAIRPRLQAAVEDVEALSFRELQAACKERGLPARGATAVLRERLREHVAADAPADAGTEVKIDLDAALAAEYGSVDELMALDADPADAFAEEATATDVVDPAYDDAFAEDLRAADADSVDALFAEALGAADADPADDDAAFAAQLDALFADQNEDDDADDALEAARRKLKAARAAGPAAAAWADLVAALGTAAPPEKDATQALRVFSRAAACDAAATVLADCEARGRSAGVGAWKLALEAYARAKKPREADQLAAEARARGVFPEQPDGPLYRSLLKHCVGACQWRRAIALLDEMEGRADVTVDGRDWNLAIFAAERLAVDASKRRGRIRTADAEGPDRVIAAMRAKGRAPEPKGLAAAVNANRYASRPDLALANLAILRASVQGKEREAWEPDYAREGVVAVLDALKRAATTKTDRDLPDATRDRYAKTAVALATAAASDDEGYKNEANEREAHFERCAVTAAGACARSFRPTAARQVLDVAKKRAAREAGGWPTTQLYNAVLDAYEAAGKTADALGLLDEFDRNGVPYDAVTYNICLRLCAREGKYERAAELLDEMVADPSPQVRPDVFSFTTAIKACCVEPKRGNRNSVDRAEFAHSLLLRCADANEVTFRTALRACLGRPDDPPPQRDAARVALGVLARMQVAGYRPDGLGGVFDGATMARLRRAARDDVGFSAEGARAAEFFGLVERRGGVVEEDEGDWK